MEQQEEIFQTTTYNVAASEKVERLIHLLQMLKTI